MRVVVIGAGPAGLAVAACLKTDGAQVTLLEKAETVGSSWRGHYDTLRLHTSRGRSGLPGLKMPARYGRYPTRADVVDYLETYVRHHALSPVFGSTVTAVTKSGDGWQVTASGGNHTADAVVFATGFAGKPNLPPYPGLSAFKGRVLHSSDYKNAAPFSGQRVLVVGFGNSGGDIALDLTGVAKSVDMAVRGPVNLLPKELFGVPITSFGFLSKIMPYRWADAVNAPILRLKLGRTQSYGLRPAGKGPIAQIVEDGRIPLIDVGTLGAIKAGRISVRPGPQSFDGLSCHFVGGQVLDYDAVIFATGYQVDLRPILPGIDAVLDATGRPLISGAETAERGLFFCSYHASAGGQLFQISQEARAIAGAISQQTA